MIKELIISLLKKWACCHEWELQWEHDVEFKSDFSYKTYTVRHYFCKKCGKHKRIKSS